MLAKIIQFFKTNFPTEEERRYRYLADSENLVDLEMRMRELDRTGIKY